MVIRTPLIFGLLVIYLFSVTPAAHGLDLSKSGYIGSFPANAPMSIASDGVSRLFVASMGGRITTTDLEGNELYSFGGPGSELEGKLFEPSGMYYYRGKLYVADSWNSIVLVLTPEGELVDVYGQSGKGAKQFNEPRGIFVNQGLIYVADTGNGRIQMLGPKGTFLRAFGSDTGLTQILRGPTGVVVRGNGNFYVLDTAYRWVREFNMRGDLLGSLMGLRSPVHIAQAGNSLVVADANLGGLRLFNEAGNVFETLGPWGKNANPFISISGIVAVGDKIYASDFGGNDVKVFRLPVLGRQSVADVPSMTPWAEYLGETLFSELVPGKLEMAPDGRVYVHDLETDRIFRLGSKTGADNVGPEGCRPVSFTIGGGGDIYCLDAEKGKVAISAPDGTVRNEFDLRGTGKGAEISLRPVDIGVSSTGEILIADRGTGKVLVYGPEGDYRGPLGLGGTQFYIKDPVAIRISGKDMVYVVDADSRKVFIYSTTGRLIRELWDHESLSNPMSVAISDEYIYLLDTDRPDIKVFSKTGMHIMSLGSRGDGKGEFSSPVSIELDAEGRLLVSDRGNQRIQSLGVHIEPEFINDMWEVKAIKQREIKVKKK